MYPSWTSLSTILITNDWKSRYTPHNHWRAGYPRPAHQAHSMSEHASSTRSPEVYDLMHLRSAHPQAVETQNLPEDCQSLSMLVLSSAHTDTHKHLFTIVMQDKAILYSQHKIGFAIVNSMDCFCIKMVKNYHFLCYRRLHS